MQIWHRLIWREFRESSPFVLIGVLLPLLCLTMRIFQRDLFAYPLFVILLVMVAVWASARAQERRDGGLPISAEQRLASRYLLPMPGVVLIGVVLGYLANVQLDVSTRPDLIPLVVGICIFTYALCTVVSSVYTLIPAILVGLVAVLSFSDPFHFGQIHWMPVHPLIVVLITAIFWEGYAGKHRVVIGRIALPVLMTLAVCWGTMITGDLFPRSSPPPAPATQAYRGNTPYPRYMKISRMEGQREYNISPNCIAPRDDYLYILGYYARFFLAQAPNDPVVRVMEWDAPAGRVNEFFRFAGYRGMLADYCYSSNPGPDDRFIFGVPSNIGHGDDLWLLDLPCRRATMVVANAERSVMDGRDSDGRNSNVNVADDPAMLNTLWSNNGSVDYVILQLARRTISLDLKTLRATSLRIGGTP